MFSQGDCSFTSLLNEDDTPDDFGTQPVTTPIVDTPSTQRKRTKNFTVLEDKLLISAYLNISIDSVHGTDQKNDTYWNRVHHYFHELKTFESTRNANSLMKRWSTIQLVVNKFCGYFAQIQSRSQSGVTGDDKIVQAMEMYLIIQKSPFLLVHCDDEVSGGFVDLERPIGRKAAKENLGKRKGKSIIDMSAAACLKFAEYVEEVKVREMKRQEERDRMYSQEQERLSVIKEMNELKRAKLRLEEKRDEERIRAETKKEEERLMDIDTTCMPEMQAEYYNQLKMEII